MCRWFDSSSGHPFLKFLTYYPPTSNQKLLKPLKWQKENRIAVYDEYSYTQMATCQHRDAEENAMGDHTPQRLQNAESFLKYWKNELFQGRSFLDHVTIVNLSLVNHHMHVRCQTIWSLLMNPAFFKAPQLEPIFPNSSELLLINALQIHFEELAKRVATQFQPYGVCKILLNFLDNELNLSILNSYLLKLTKEKYSDFVQYLVINHRDLSSEKLLYILNETGTAFWHVSFYNKNVSPK